MLVRGSDLTLGGLERCLQDDGEAGWTLDLRSTRWVDPYGLVFLASVIDRASRSGTPTRFAGPLKRGCANYLSRMHVGDRLEEAGIHHDLPHVGERSLAGRLAELEPFESSNEVRRLADVVYSRLSDNYAASLVAPDLYEALHELCSNALEHAGTDRGFIAAQVYNRGERGQYLIFAIGDGGIGIRASLDRGGYRAENDTAAVSLALESDVSASQEPGRGQGLPDVVWLLGAAAGTVLIRTGTAKVRIAASRHDEQVSHLNGTIVAARVACGAGPERR